MLVEFFSSEDLWDSLYVNNLRMGQKVLFLIYALYYYQYHVRMYRNKISLDLVEIEATNYAS